MHLLGPESFRFAVVMDPTLKPAQRTTSLLAVEQRLRSILEQKRMRNVKFKVEVVEVIPLNAKSRKYELIVDQTIRV